VNSYLVMMASGVNEEFEADAYERDGSDWVFSVGGSEVGRIPSEGVVAITKA
jgi:hypothetical protein